MSMCRAIALIFAVIKRIYRDKNIRRTGKHESIRYSMFAWDHAWFNRTNITWDDIYFWKFSGNRIAKEDFCGIRALSQDVYSWEKPWKPGFLRYFRSLKNQGLFMKFYWDSGSFFFKLIVLIFLFLCKYLCFNFNSFNFEILKKSILLKYLNFKIFYNILLILFFYLSY